MKPVMTLLTSLTLATGFWINAPQPVELAQQFSDRCITPFSFCFSEVLFPVGTPCFCPDGSAGVIQF